MARLRKFKASSLKSMTAYYAGGKDVKKINFRKRDDGLNDVEFIQQRIEKLNLKRKPRSDAVMMCCWTLFLPKEVQEKDKLSFFYCACSYMTELYGKENVVSAWLRLGKTPPRMYFAFVPVTSDGRLSAKDVITREHLQTWHEHLRELIKDNLGYEVSLVTPKNTNNSKRKLRDVLKNAL